MSYRLLEDHPTHYVVHDGASAFPVAKRGLSPELHQRIQGLAGGGEVQPNFSDVQSGDSSVSLQADQDAAAASQAQQAAELKADEAKGAAEGAAAHGSHYDGPLTRAAGAVASIFRPPSADFTAGKSLPATPPAATSGAGEQKLDVPASAPAAPTPATAPVAPPKPAGGVGGGADQRALDATYGQENQAAADKAAADREQAARDQVYLNEKVKEEQRIEAARAQQQAANEAHIKPLEDAVLSGKIDPSRFWNSKDAAGKMTSVIGILLGGIAGGINKTGQNVGLDVINRQIEQDIDAQKSNLNHQSNLLNYFRGRGHDIDTSAALATQVLQRHVEAQLQQSAAMTKDPQIQAQLRQTQAQIGQQRIFSSKKLAADQVQLREGQQRVQMNDQALASSAQGVEQQKAIQEAMQNGQLTPGIVNSPAFPKDLRERSVVMPDGSVQFASDPKSKEALDKLHSEVLPGVDAVQGLRKLVKDYGTLSPGDLMKQKAQLEARAGLLVASLPKSIAGSTRLSEADIKFFEKVVGDPGLLFKGAADARLSALGDDLQSRLNGAYKAYGLRGPGKKADIQQKRPGE